jgi:hypothetical protein
MPTMTDNDQFNELVIDRRSIELYVEGDERGAIPRRGDLLRVAAAGRCEGQTKDARQRGNGANKLLKLKKSWLLQRLYKQHASME